MEAFTETNALLFVVGPKEINFKSAGIRLRLEERWKGEEGAKRVEEINDYYAMGQSVKLNRVPEVVNCLAKRDYPSVYYFNGEKKIDAIFVPDSYNPRKPNMVVLDKENIPMERTMDDFNNAVGDMAERSVYEVLKAIFTHKKFNGSVLVIQGLEMLAIDPKKRRRKHHREMDFLIIHHELSCVINIEVKNSLRKESKRKDVKQQLIENQHFFEEWFGADISPKWTWVSMVYTEQPFPEGVKDTFEKNEYIASGQQALEQKLLKILSGQQVNTPVSDFKLICKYLLFCSPAKPLAIGMNQIKRTEEAMAKQGSVENIKVWCFPTPEQRAIFNHDKVLFLAAWGTGKTLLMQSKAFFLAERGENVLFIIYQNDPLLANNPEVFKKSEITSLLFFQMQLKFKAYDKVTVKPLWEEDFLNLDMIGSEFKHIMIDELPGDISKLKKDYQKNLLQFIRKKQSVWISVSGDTVQASEIEYNDRTLDKVEEKWFPDCNFKTARIRIPLRSPKKILDNMNEEMKDSKRHKNTLNRFLFTRSKIPPTLTEGKVINIKMDMDWSLTECMKHCLADIPKGASSIIIIQRIQPMTKSDDFNNQIIAQLFRSSLRQLKEAEPLFYTNEFCSPDIENWLTQGSVRHLVISQNLVNGFEHNIVINLNHPTYSSRSSGYLIITGQIWINLYYMTLPILDYFELNDYCCKYLHLCELYLDTPLDVIDNKLNKIGLSRLAVYTDAENENPLLAALHFLREESQSSLEEVMLPVKQQYELEMKLLNKLPPIFQWVKSCEDVLVMNLWKGPQLPIPEEMKSLAYNTIFEIIARCSKRKISWIRITNLRGTLPPEVLNTFGRQYAPETNFCVVEFVYDSKLLPFAVTARKDLGQICEQEFIEPLVSIVEPEPQLTEPSVNPTNNKKNKGKSTKKKKSKKRQKKL